MRPSAARLALAILMALPAPPALAEGGGRLRIATYDAGLSRAMPGLLLRDIEAGEAQVEAAAAVIRAVRPDILLLSGFDHDAGREALAAFAARLAADGAGDPLSYAHLYAGPVNAGWPSGRDLDGDGSAAGPGDAFGWGRFPGQGGLALLSHFPVAEGESRDFRLLAWRDLPAARLPLGADGAPFPSAEAQAAMRLSSRAHLDIAVDTPGGRLRLLASAPTPPVFDGPEDANGLRNGDEILFWRHYIEGAAFADAGGTKRQLEPGPFVILGPLNADPEDGEGDHAAIGALLAHPLLRDPAPAAPGGAAAAAQGGANASHAGDPARDTADWRDGSGGPGNLRVDYVLPWAGLEVLDAGVFWPAPGTALAETVAAASDHRLVWVDLAWP